MPRVHPATRNLEAESHPTPPPYKRDSSAPSPQPRTRSGLRAGAGNPTADAVSPPARRLLPACIKTGPGGIMLSAMTAMNYIECDLPEGMVLAEWRRAKRRRPPQGPPRAALAPAARVAVRQGAAKLSSRRRRNSGGVTAILSLSVPSDRRAAARATAGGAALFYGFGNFCALAALPDHTVGAADQPPQGPPARAGRERDQRPAADGAGLRLEPHPAPLRARAADLDDGRLPGARPDRLPRPGRGDRPRPPDRRRRLHAHRAAHLARRPLPLERPGARGARPAPATTCSSSPRPTARAPARRRTTRWTRSRTSSATGATW